MWRFFFCLFFFAWILAIHNHCCTIPATETGSSGLGVQAEHSGSGASIVRKVRPTLSLSQADFSP
jgi:hypothetical protein